MKRNLVILTIIILLLSSHVVALPSTLNKDKSLTPLSTTLYVGGTGPGNYSTIQEALDNTTNGDTVFVYGGYYFENITINTSIQVLGENQKTTVIDAQEHGPVVTILADNVTLYNFSIQNACEPLFTMENGINVRSHNNTIKHNIIGPKNSAGLILYNSHNNTITRNTFYYNRDAITLSGSTNNTILENQIGFSDVAGINIWDSNDNQIIRNNFMFNMINTLISGNTFELINNSWDGNYWSIPLYHVKRLPVFIFPLKIAFQYDKNPATHPNGKLEISTYTANNTLLRLRGRVSELFNTSSWNGVGLKIGRISSLGIIVNESFGESLRIFGAHEFEMWSGRIQGHTEILIENALGIFNRPQMNLLKNLPPRIYILCFAEKLTETYYSYWFSWE
ncbi:MAG: right-handed parallel beta-helix repeat-containing protein [Candidatus Thermoplasmatota archaeon]|nr:right-handed parallel beta-helix repeat-containing protein [Candidatus Thermoplasmatota archaeon]MBU1940425.1 right-handed parallel beta-helix repeat-containing protein [Candidatus Thermoplasmatota archaeon]